LLYSFNAFIDKIVTRIQVVKKSLGAKKLPVNRGNEGRDRWGKGRQ